MASDDFVTATNALFGADPADKETAGFHNIAGVVDAAANRYHDAEEHFLQASRLEPQNPSPQLNLAVVRLQGSNDMELEQSRALLEHFAGNTTNANLRCQALRELAADALRRQRLPDALTLSRQLVQETNCAFKDKLLRLDALQASHGAEFKAELAEACQKEAAIGARPPPANSALWEMSHVSARDTFNWLRTLPAQGPNQPARRVAHRGMLLGHERLEAT